MKKIILLSMFFFTFTSFISLNGQWARTYGGSDGDYPRSIQQTSDGGYIVAGYTESFGAGSGDVWILKLSSNGAVEWQRAYGGSDADYVRSIQQTSDGGYIVAVWSFSFVDLWTVAWVLKLSSNGAVEWQRTYGDSGVDSASFIQQTSDGGYIVSGTTTSFGAGSGDVWILKLSSNGAVEWQRTYGGSDYDTARFIQQTSDGGYIVAGYTESFGAGVEDIWILKLTSNGAVEWQRTYGGSSSDESWRTPIQQTSDGGYIVAGYTESFGAGVEDIWILKLTSNGAVEWQRTYGDSGVDSASFIQQTTDGGYIMGGIIYSFGAGEADFLVLKLYSDGDIDPSCEFIGSSNASVLSTYVYPEDSYISPGNTYVTPLATNVSPQDTDATVNILCGSQKYSLTISTTSGGTTDPSPGIYTYDSGTEVTITAIPENGYRFSEWSGDASGTSNPITITMDSDKSVKADFIREYTLTIDAGTGGTTDPAPGTYTYDSGTQVTITAKPNSGYSFSSWSGDASGSTNPITITMDSNKSVKANFTKISSDGDKDGKDGVGGCFIVTACYGTAMAEEVKTLCAFRDKYLLTNPAGQAFVVFYYKHSPSLADFIRDRKHLKTIVRGCLRPFIWIISKVVK